MDRTLGLAQRVNNPRAMDAAFRCRKQAFARLGGVYRRETSRQPFRRCYAVPPPKTSMACGEVFAPPLISAARLTWTFRRSGAFCSQWLLRWLRADLVFRWRLRGIGQGRDATRRGATAWRCAATEWRPHEEPQAVLFDPFLADLEERTFRFFWETASPKNGLVPDRYPTPSFASIAAVGFALTAYPIGVERGYITRAQAAQRALATLSFFMRAPNQHGFFYHFLDMKTGARANDARSQPWIPHSCSPGCSSARATSTGRTRARSRYASSRISSTAGWTGPGRNRARRR